MAVFVVFSFFFSLNFLFHSFMQLRVNRELKINTWQTVQAISYFSISLELNKSNS